MGDMSYFANLAKNYALQSLDLSNTHFDRSGRLNNTEKSVSESQQRIKMIQRKINARPREKLNFLTPDEVVYKKTS